jgi:hypothetical protein
MSMRKQGISLIDGDWSVTRTGVGMWGITNGFTTVMDMGDGLGPQVLLPEVIINGFRNQATLQPARGYYPALSGTSADQEGGDYDFGKLNDAFSLAGLVWGISEKSIYNNSYWFSIKNLKYNSTSWGGNFRTGGRSVAEFLAKPGRILGDIGLGVNVIYGLYSVSSAIENSDYSKAGFSGLGTIYSGIASKGGVPGLIIAGPMVLIDATVGLDNFWQSWVNNYIERANRISQGNTSMIWNTPGRTIK